MKSIDLEAQHLTQFHCENTKLRFSNLRQIIVRTIEFTLLENYRPGVLELF